MCNFFKEISEGRRNLIFSGISMIPKNGISMNKNLNHITISKGGI